MDKDHILGSIRQLAEAIKQTVGTVFGDRKIETEGTGERAEGKAQNALGGLRDIARGFGRR